MNLRICFLVLMSVMTSLSVIAQDIADIKLPDPIKTGGKPLMEALQERQSVREFSEKELTWQQISDLLWAANGINRSESGKRTAPTAMNDQEIDIYISLKSGIYLYDAVNNILKVIKAGDYRSDMGKQKFVGTAPLVLVYVADYARMSIILTKKHKDFYSATDVGFVSQNVYLYAASENMATVVLGWINKSSISKIMGLKKSQHVLLTQPVGFKK